MASYSLSQLSIQTSLGHCAWELIAGAKGFLLREIGFTNHAATAGCVGLGRPAAKGLVPTTPVLFQPNRFGDADAVATGAVAWGTEPTVPAAFLREASLPAAVGASVVWDLTKSLPHMPKGGTGIVVPPLGSIILWLLGASSALDAYAVIDQ